MAWVGGIFWTKLIIKYKKYNFEFLVSKPPDGLQQLDFRVCLILIKNVIQNHGLIILPVLV